MDWFKIQMNILSQCWCVRHTKEHLDGTVATRTSDLCCELVSYDVRTLIEDILQPDIMDEMIIRMVTAELQEVATNAR